MSGHSPAGVVLFEKRTGELSQCSSCAVGINTSYFRALMVYSCKLASKIFDHGFVVAFLMIMWISMFYIRFDSPRKANRSNTTIHICSLISKNTTRTRTRSATFAGLVTPRGGCNATPEFPVTAGVRLPRWRIVSFISRSGSAESHAMLSGRSEFHRPVSPQYKLSARCESDSGSTARNGRISDEILLDIHMRSSHVQMSDV